MDDAESGAVRLSSIAVYFMLVHNQINHVSVQNISLIICTIIITSYACGTEYGTQREVWRVRFCNHTRSGAQDGLPP
jgi:hypothetical protein